MKIMKHIGFFLLALLALAGCQTEAPVVGSGLEGYYYVPRMSKLRLHTAYEGQGYRWTLHLPDGRDSLLSTERDLLFLAGEEGDYNITFTLDDGDRGYQHSFPVHVVHEETEYSPYIARVLEYEPAPGQFVNTMPHM